MEKGEGNEYRGKSLDEININIEELLFGEEEESADEENDVNSHETTLVKTNESSKSKKPKFSFQKNHSTKYQIMLNLK